MSTESSIFKALNESKKAGSRTKRSRNEAFEDPQIEKLPMDNALEEEEEPVLESLCPDCNVELVDGVCPECGYVEETVNEEDEELDPLEEENCPDCGAEMGDEENCPDCGAVVEEDEDDPLLTDVSERSLKVGRYNMDTVRMMGEMLTRAKAPNAIRKAYNMKMYERCAKWLKTVKGMDVDLREGFSKSEQRIIRKKLNEMKAPKYVRQAFEGGQYSIVSSYFKAKNRG